MIIKHVAMRSLGKSDFASLARYIIDDQSKDHRLGHVRVTNCESGSVEAAIEEVVATQYLNTRAASDKTYHLIVSFRAGEQPDEPTLAAIESRICAGLGYAEHQRVSAVHNDTDNLHVHIAVNKIHPQRRTIHEPYYPHRTLAALCELLEDDYGLQRDNHLVQQRGAAARATDMEHHAGIESLVGWIKRECLHDLRSASSWAELHQMMYNNGLQLRERGNGLVVAASDGTLVKASTLARELSKPALEARLGPFEASPEKFALAGQPGYRKAPLRSRVNTTELYARYQREQKHLSAARSNALKTARQKKERAVAAAKRINRLRRAAIKLLNGRDISKKLLYAQASVAMKMNLNAVARDYARAKVRHYHAFQRRAWVDWLKQEATQGNVEALAALRARVAAKGLRGDTLVGRGSVRPSYSTKSDIDSITKKGTIIYRAGLSAVRDDGDRLQISREASSKTYYTALRLAAERFGSEITVNGSPEFKARMVRAAVDSRLPITFANPGLERRRRALLSTQESTHEKGHQSPHRGRADQRGAGRLGQGAGTNSGFVGDSKSRRGPAYGDDITKPNVGRVGRVPPPASQHRLRTLSQLRMVRIDGRSEMLLPGDVLGHLEQRGAPSHITLRRRIPGFIVSREQALAAEKYIDEREKKRLIGFDIPKHIRYTETDRPLVYAGSRQIDGLTLVLLACDENIMVLPADPTDVRPLKQISRGERVSVTEQGRVVARTKGHSR